MDTGLLGLMMYCAGIVGGVVVASWIVDMIENLQKDSWRNLVTADDIEQLGRLLKK